MENTQFYYLLQTIQLIASDYDVQIKSFPDFVHVPDEIALLLEENMFILETLDVSDPKNEALSAQIKLLDNFFANLDKDKFTLDELRSATEWKKAREMAQVILETLGVERKKPDLSWLRFAK